MLENICMDGKKFKNLDLKYATKAARNYGMGSYLPIQQSLCPAPNEE